MSRAGSLARAFGSDGALNIGDIGNVAATAVPYSNAVSGISANTVQEAIDYLNTLSSGGAGDVASYTRQKFTATAGQTTFTVTAGYTVGYLQVFMNGILLDVSDYTASDGSTVVLTAAAASNDEIVTIALDSFNIAELLRVTNISASATADALTLDATNSLYLKPSAKVYTQNPAGGRYGSFYTDSTGTVLSSWNGSGEPLYLKAPVGPIRMVAGGIEGLVISTAGIVTKPNHPSFRYARTTSFTTNSAGVAVTFNTKYHDIGNDYTSDYFTAPVGGVYFFHAHLQPITTGQYAYINFLKNGTALGYTLKGWNTLPSRGDISVTTTLELAQGDTIKVYAYSSGTCTWDNHGIFTGFLIG